MSDDLCFCGAAWVDEREECAAGHAFGETDQLRLRAEEAEGRIDDVKLWARARVKVCREQETKFGDAWQVDSVQGKSTIPRALIEASTERRALEAVLRILDGEESS